METRETFDDNLKKIALINWEYRKRLLNIMHEMCSKMEENTYIYRRNADEVREYFWKNEKETAEAFNVYYEEFCTLWDLVKGNYNIAPYYTRQQALGFFRDVQGVLYKGRTIDNSFSFPSWKVAELLEVEEETVDYYYRAIIAHKISERQGGGIVF